LRIAVEGRVNMILGQIVEVKRKEVARLKETWSIPTFERLVRDLPPTRDFGKALTTGDCAIIAEVKRRSPSKGLLCGDFDVSALARTYEANGAAAVSVLTDRLFFGGDDADIAAVKRACALPVLRKDFIIDPYQVYETRILGADALLLIAAILGKQELDRLLRLAQALDLSAVVEVHGEEEIEAAAGAQIIGINNRDLKTFTTNINTSLRLAPLLPPGRIVVSESGFENRADVELLMEAGIRAFLVGETLMRAGDRGAKLRELAGK